ncbi:MAG: 30S ribosomal protein S1 [Bacteroidota bacterium]
MADIPNTETPDLDIETTTDGSEAAAETVVTEAAPDEPTTDTTESEDEGSGEEEGDGSSGNVGTLVEPDPEPTPEPEATAEPEAAAEDVAVPSAESSEEPTVVEAVAEAVAETAEPVIETVTEAVDSAVETVTEMVESNDAPDASSPDASVAHGATVGYTGKDLGRTVTIEELEQADAANAGVSGIGASSQVADHGAAPDEMASLYENSLSAVEADQIVTGTVVGLTDKEVVVDIGFKSDGVVAKNEFGIIPEVGDEIDVYVDRLEDRRGQLTLSYSKGIDKSRWNIVQEAMESGAVIEGEIVKRIKGGMIVNLLGAEAFLPGSQVDVRPVRDFDVYLGKTMEFKVVKTNPSNGNIVISHKALIEKDLQAQRTLILDSLEVGQVLEGVVKNIVNFGVFVDLGGVDGLLHITDLSWGRVGHPSEVVELDQKMQVVVLDYDKERQRISLGYKQLQKHPWDDLAERLAEGMEIEGRVVSITDYGAFVEIERGIEGLVHISEMSWTEHVKHPTQRVQLGQTVKVKVLKVDGADKKISLGMKQLEPDPWEGLLERFPVGTITRGKVRNITTFGAFVEIEPGIDGLVHVSDLSWTKRVKHPSEVVKKGQELDVIVVDIDIAQRRISLGHKQVSTDPWQQYAEVYGEGADTTGKVTEINDGGVVVELPLEAEAFVPASHLDRAGRPADAYQIGDELEIRIIRMDREDREIVGSETAKGRASAQAEKFAERQAKTEARRQERREIESYGSRSSSGPATLGELSGLAALRDQLAESEAAEPDADDATDETE